MLNSKPRFAYDEETDSIYDYAAAKYVKVEEGATIDENGGKWDLEALKVLILRNMDITPAFTAGGGSELTDKVEQANKDFLTYGTDPVPGDPEAAAASDAAVAAAEAQAAAGVPEPEVVTSAQQALEEAQAHAQAEGEAQAEAVAKAKADADALAVSKGELPAPPEVVDAPVAETPVTPDTPAPEPAPEPAPAEVATPAAETPVGSGG